MRIVTRTWIYILAGFLNDAYKDNKHWCIDFLREADEEAKVNVNVRFAID